MRNRQLWHSLEDVGRVGKHNARRTLAQRQQLVIMLNNGLRDALNDRGWVAYAHYLHGFHKDGLQGTLFFCQAEPATDQELIAQEETPGLY